MMSFEEFAKQFDMSQPEECVKLLHQYEAYIDAVWKEYAKRWTWCGGCHKTVRFDKAITKREPLKSTGELKEITRCPECGCPWFIKDVEVQNGAN